MSHPRTTRTARIGGMSPMSVPAGGERCLRACALLPSAAEANAALRAFAAGRAVWTDAALLELDRLRTVWAAAVQREAGTREMATAA